jgi:hypothetical protein
VAADAHRPAAAHTPAGRVVDEQLVAAPVVGVTIAAVQIHRSLEKLPLNPFAMRSALMQAEMDGPEAAMRAW